MESRRDKENLTSDEASEASVKVVDRRWWARGETGANDDAGTAQAKPAYVEELEARLAEKDRILQAYAEQFKAASTEFEQARVRGRREVAREVERGRRTLLVDLLEVIDNLDRALDAAESRADAGPLLQGVRMVRDQFLSKLEGYGVREIEAIGQRFEPTLHEAVSVVPVDASELDDHVAGVVRRGYRIGDDVLRPAQVAVGTKRKADG
jgi:molecular chaperone GrpE